MIRRPPRSPLFPTTPLSRSQSGPEDPEAAAKPEAKKPDPALKKKTKGRDLGNNLPEEDPYKPIHINEQGDNERLIEEDRKSTRLNSSHLVISYAVFCLKKKK